VLDLYPYATTSPIYVTAPAAHAASVKDARYFVAWIDRLIASADSNESWNTSEEKQSVINLLQEARHIYGAMSP
jgi:hypothetical protein